MLSSRAVTEERAHPLASVVIPTLDAGPGFEETLEAVRAQRGVGAPEIVVLDSESRDGTTELARRAGAHVRRVARATFNHGATRNLGAALARGRFVAFLTQDALPANDQWLAALVEAIEEEGAVGATSRVLPRPGCSPLVERSVRRDIVHADERVVKRATRDELARLSPLERRVLVHFNNVASCVRRDFLERLPFPEIPFGEDLAFGLRAIERGEALVHEPRSLVLHSHESDLSRDRARHAQDARLMRLLFGLRVREPGRGALKAWWEEVRADFAFVANRPLPWREKLAQLLYAPLLRAAQVAGQVEGTCARPGPPPVWPGSLPLVERPATAPAVPATPIA
jgi:rhamnosyltransferase